MFDTWQFEPQYAYDSGSGFDWNQIINRGLDVIGGRYSPGYVSPDDPRYDNQGGWWGNQYPIGGGGGGYGGSTYPYPNPNTQVGIGGSVSLTTIALGVLVLVMLTRGGGRR